MPIIIIALGITCLLVLIMVYRLNAFLALILVAIGVGLAIGMPATEVMSSIQKGVGGTLGYLALILGLGAMLGALVAESGAAQSITNKLIGIFGLKKIHWALMITGFIVGIPLFYSVGFLMLIPIIFAVAASTGLNLLYVGIPMIASLSVTHGFLPPHPAPTAIVEFYNADINKTLLYGFILAIPAVIIAGPVFGSFLKNIKTKPPKNLFKLDPMPEDQLPPFWVGVFTALIPVILMAASAIFQMTLPQDHLINDLFGFLGNPVLALLIAVMVGVFTLGTRNGRSFSDVMDSLAESVKAIAMIMMIIAGGGAFKQVLVDSGISDYIVDLLKDTQISPIILVWCMAAALRIALGSATVAALTAAGFAIPFLEAPGMDVTPEILVLATGAGSLTCSQVNDTGFWLFKEYFNLTITETLKTWTVMETIISLVGLVGCLILEAII